MFTNDLLRVFGKIVAPFLVPLSCLAATFPDYPVRQVGDCPVTAEKPGFAIGVQPVEQLKDQRTYFRTELAPKGFIPVFIVLENRSTVDSFLFDKTRITYGSADSDISGPQVRSKTGEGVALACAAAGSGPGLIIALKLISNATQVQQNILKKEVQSKTLSPGGSVRGFLYVRVAKEGPREKIHLRVPITRAGTDETLVFDLLF
jgi:hypothetical protein